MSETLILGSGADIIRTEEHGQYRMVASTPGAGIGQSTRCESCEHAARIKSGGHVIGAVGGNGISADGICALPAG